MTVITALDQQLVIPTRPCTPWCQDGNAHADQHPDDRWCTSAPMPPIPLDRHHHQPELMVDGAWRRPFLEVLLGREYTDESPHLVLRSENNAAETYLALSDVARLRDQLTALLDLADQA